MFIAVEGIDGSGKGTQTRLLNRWIKERGHETFLTREPTGGIIGQLLREILKKGELDSRTEALLFAADRAEHVKEILPKLAEGRVVISERYFYSSIAYQGASGVSIRWLTELNRFAPVPELVLYMDVSPEAGLERISSKNSLRSSMREKEYFEKQDFLGKVREVYLDLANKNGFAVIDASGTIDEVQTAIRRVVSRSLSEFEETKKRPTQKGLGDF